MMSGCLSAETFKDDQLDAVVQYKDGEGWIKRKPDE